MDFSWKAKITNTSTQIDLCGEIGVIVFILSTQQSKCLWFIFVYFLRIKFSIRRFLINKIMMFRTIVTDGYLIPFWFFNSYFQSCFEFDWMFAFFHFIIFAWKFAFVTTFDMPPQFSFTFHELNEFKLKNETTWKFIEEFDSCEWLWI